MRTSEDRTLEESEGKSNYLISVFEVSLLYMNVFSEADVHVTVEKNL